MIRQAISPRLAIKIRLNMPFGDPNPSRPNGFAVFVTKKSIEARGGSPCYNSVVTAGYLLAGMSLKPAPSLVR
jgi:hypothetical protein